MSEVVVFDIEADNLLADVTKIHCLCYNRIGDSRGVETITDYESMANFFSQKDTIFIGHNIYLYDMQVVKKILGVEVNYNNVVDTLGLSHYLHSSKPSSYKNGLEAYGERYGVPKPKVDDWNNLSLEEYVHRCTEDVKINTKLWEEQQAQLFELYENNTVEIKRLIAYINSKLDVLLEQQNNPIPLNIELIGTEIARLEKLVEEKREPLKQAMPKLPIKAKAVKPKVLHKKDGSLSVAGEKWISLCKLHNQDLEEESFEYILSYDEPNPDSIPQLKDWLFGLGWQPTHYKFNRDKKTNEFKQVPQIKNEYDDTDICDSVKELVSVEPAIEHLASYSTIKHRLTIYKGFLNDMNSDLTITAEALGWTNTMRLKHRKLVNLPKPTAPYAEHIRECLVAPKDSYMVGADLVAIEDSTKQSYIYKYDPDYVNDMRTEGFDPHLDVAVRAGLLSEQQAENHKSGIESFKEERSKAKTVNFASVYGVGAKTLARNMKVKEKEAKSILDAYWERNKSVKQFSASCQTKTIDGQMWVKQPVSGFWYTLRSEKDIFSTVNQGTAVYVFDVWLAFARRQGIVVSGQWHDELVTIVPNKVSQEITSSLLKKAIQQVNNKLKLNIPIDCSVDFGKSYRDVH